MSEMRTHDVCGSLTPFSPFYTPLFTALLEYYIFLELDVTLKALQAISYNEQCDPVYNLPILPLYFSAFKIA